MSDELWVALSAEIPEDDPHHPLSVLGIWALMIAEDYGHELPLQLTVQSAAAYLDRQLDRIAADDEQDFPLLVREVAACLSHLEAVLAVGRFREAGAPCAACVEAGVEKAPRLVMHRHECAGCKYGAPPESGMHDHSGAGDRWVCPTNGTHAWTDAEYRLRVGTDYLEHADRLTASQIRQRFRVAEGTVRVWANRGLVRKRGTDPSGRMLYDVEDVKARREAESA